MVHLRVEVVPVSIRLVMMRVRIFNFIRFFAHLVVMVATIISVIVYKLFLAAVLLVVALLRHVLKQVVHVLTLSICVVLLLRLVKALEIVI